MILPVDSEGPDQTTQMQRLVWDFAVSICTEDTLFYIMTHDICYLSYLTSFCYRIYLK